MPLIPIVCTVLFSSVLRVKTVSHFQQDNYMSSITFQISSQLHQWLAFLTARGWWGGNTKWKHFHTGSWVCLSCLSHLAGILFTWELLELLFCGSLPVVDAMAPRSAVSATVVLILTLWSGWQCALCMEVVWVAWAPCCEWADSIG